MKFAPPRGLRDFYPEEMRLRNRLFEVWRNVSRRVGFEEYDAPVVETQDLLIRKSGEEIVHQIYTFEDKSGRRLALRPEMTPSLARMIVARQKALSFPLKWCCIAQCFRYERMMKGRKREHYQWNLDVVGEESVSAEAEVIAAAIEALRELGLTSSDFQVRIGSRALLGELFAAQKFDMRHFASACLMLDKRGKISDEKIRDLLRAEGLSGEDVETVFSILKLVHLEEAAQILKGKTKALTDLERLFEAMTDYGLREYVTFDLSIIRGLAYYTGIVFEAFDTEKKFRAIFGGGRYDNLLSTLGGPCVPSVGLGFGDVVVQELLAHLGKQPTASRSVDVAIGYMTLASQGLAIRAASMLRARDLGVDLQLTASKPGKFFRVADKCGASWTVYIGPEEATRNAVNLKNMTTGDQVEVPVAQIAGRIAHET
ncbi:MAG: histidine--tRNA ligase [Candidatus Latescibacteria bacterium]|nr:histidine--tRNA ligase [Candidatus Latescibacterota bacterium]